MEDQKISVTLTGPAKIDGKREPEGKTVSVSPSVALQLAASGVINPCSVRGNRTSDGRSRGGRSPGRRRSRGELVNGARSLRDHGRGPVEPGARRSRCCRREDRGAGGGVKGLPPKRRTARPPIRLPRPDRNPSPSRPALSLSSRAALRRGGGISDRRPANIPNAGSSHDALCQH